MATVTKNIGYVPTYIGEYSSSVKYYEYNIVAYLNGVWICTTTGGLTGTAPCTVDDDGTFTVNDGWDALVDPEGYYNTGDKLSLLLTATAQALAQVEARLAALEEGKQYLGEAHAETLSVRDMEGLHIGGSYSPWFIEGEGAPSSTTIPAQAGYALKGQVYYDTENDALYIGVGNSESVSDWRQIY